MTQLHFKRHLELSKSGNFGPPLLRWTFGSETPRCFVGFPKFGLSTYPKWGSHSYKNKHPFYRHRSTDWNTIQIRRSGINFKSLRLTLFFVAGTSFYVSRLHRFTPIKLHSWYRFTRGIFCLQEAGCGSSWCCFLSWNPTDQLKFIWNSYFISFCVCFVLHE